MSSPLQQGNRLGRYEIKAQLGTGGMGEVYLAWDSALDRKVAIKILPEDVAANPLSMQRFVQEAKAASALNHPNILTIHEIGTEPGTHFIATEFVEGETLRHRMAHDGLTIERSIDIALQLASALATAHSAGIVHRDIKPENIMLRHDGIVKVLDFGLAKLTEKWRSTDIDEDAATMAMVQTQPGVIVGTTAYMSPEQTRALSIDTRTDIWSLGVVLYEMLAGRPPFRGDTPSDTSAAILTREPPALADYVPEIPFELERIVNKALQKDREERYQVVKDLELDLKSLRRALELNNSTEILSSSQSRSHRSLGATRLTNHSQATTVREILPTKKSWFWPVVVGAVVVASLVGFLWLYKQGSVGRPQLSNLAVVQLVSRKNDLGETASHARFSPDGKFVAYAWTKDGVSSIWIKQVSGGEPFTNKSTPGIAATPVWSPDGQQIAFISRRDAESGIWVMPAFGGAATLVKPVEGVSLGLVAWSKSNQIYFISRGNLQAVDLNTREVSDVVKFDSARALERHFGISPDGQHIVYSDFQNGQRDLFVVSKSGDQRKQITNDQSSDTRPVWTPDGEAVVYSSSRNGIKQLFLAYLDGRPAQQLTVNDSNSEVLDISPDGTRILYATTGDEADLWSVNVEQGSETKVTADIGLEFWPDVSPDGKKIAFQQSRATAGVSPFTSFLVVKSMAGGSDQVQLSPDGFEPRWSPDGKQIAFLRYKGGLSDLWVVPAEGGQPKQLTHGGVSFGGFVYLPYNRAQTQDFQWSADSRKLLYCAEAEFANVWEIGVEGGTAKQLTDNTTKGVRFFDAMFSPNDETVAWVALMQPQPGKNLTWSIGTAKQGKSQTLFESESVLDLVGWSLAGSDLLVKSMTGRPMSSNLPVDVELMSIPTQGGARRQLAQLKDTYFQNIHRAKGREEVAFVTRQGGTDSLHVISTSGGASRLIITNNDAQSYLSALVWSADRKNIYYGKQVSWTVLSMIENFKTK